MKKNNDTLMTAFDHIDARFISEAMAYYGEGHARPSRITQKAKHFIVLASAACLALILLAIPTLLIKRQEHIYDPFGVGAENSGGEVSTVPEHDGSRGLVYEINADGKSASFVGFGSCNDQTAVIASYYGGLPVTEVRLKRKSTDRGAIYIKNLIISDTVRIFDEAVIAACPNLEGIYFGANTEEIITSQSINYKITRLEVSPENKKYYSRENCIIERATKTLVRGCSSSIIPSDGSVVIIGDRAFRFVVGLYDLEIPESVNVIGKEAFLRCDNLEKMTLPAGLKYLGNGTFLFCRGLKSIDLNGYTLLPDRVFQHATALTELKGSENITEIGEAAFEMCRELSLTLSPSLRKIGKHAFLNFGESVTFTGTRAEWNSIEKSAAWNAYSMRTPMLKVISCSDGDLKVTPVPTYDH